MKHNTTLSILLTIVTAISSIFILYQLTNKNEKNNGFNRVFLHIKLKEEKEIQFSDLYDQLVGSYNNKLYFKTNEPGTFLITDSLLDNPDTLTIKLPQLNNLAPAYWTYIKNNQIHILGGNVPGLITYNLLSNQVSFKSLPFYFTKGIVISNQTGILKTTDPKSKRQVMKKYNFISGKNEAENKSLFASIDDGGFSNDGRIISDEQLNLYYIHYYKNGVQKLDNNLNTMASFHTIDTCTTSQIKFTKKTDGNKTVYNLSAPPTYVNATATIYKDRLYVHSLLKSDNENKATFLQNSTIDMYNKTTGAYQGSFHIPNKNGKRLISFYIHQNKIITLYPNTIVLYTIIKP
ncbi:hypothetical protein C3K47_11000 [Solitalea longa]|uniref:Uncharacterized protein n=1 Tax=Solitalea longa TaxID=2079460 RepID=A0A2S5A145_9SPHI|nr:hypothetical protein [Solitalea longa]POY36275.1 hypothetical protein C3K47_11000 [Solitalea longa]